MSGIIVPRISAGSVVSVETEVLEAQAAILREDVRTLPSTGRVNLRGRARLELAYIERELDARGVLRRTPLVVP